MYCAELRPAIPAHREPLPCESPIPTIAVPIKLTCEPSTVLTTLPPGPTINPADPPPPLDELLADAGELEQAGVMLGAGLLLATQALPLQDHHRQLVVCW